MDRFVYVAMTGAREAQRAQTATTHNLANASTTGFRGTLAGFETVGVRGPGHEDARAYAVTRGRGTDFQPGAQIPTGRDLDVAVEGEGWIAVMAPDGGEAYTRAGDLRLDELGRLTTGTGLAVMGDGGPIAVPPAQTLEIGGDGTVSVRPIGQGAEALAVIDRIRLVNPDPAGLVRGDDGLLRVPGGEPPPADAGVTLARGMLEGSNVNAVGEMVNMIQLARHFELQVQMMRKAEDNDRASAQLLQMS